jgi:hypothetical protein
MGDTISGVHDNTSDMARGVQGEHSLDGDIHGGGVEGLEHDLIHLLSVGLGVQGRGRGAPQGQRGALQEKINNAIIHIK